MTRSGWLVLLALGCTPGPAPTPAESAGGEAAPSACPHASDVRHAHVRAGSGGAHWGIALGAVFLHGEDAYEEPDPPVQIVPREEVVARGFEPGPDVVWVLRPGAPACRAAVTSFSRTWVADGAPNFRYEAVTADCLGAEADGTDGWISSTEPGDACALHLVEPTGGVDLGYGDDGSTFVPPQREPVPAPYAAFVPEPEAYSDLSPEDIAAAPVLWRMFRVSGTPDLVELWVTQIVADPPDEPCSWLWAGSVSLHAADGSPIPWPASEYGSRERSLAGVLSDGVANRVLLLTDLAWSGAYELAEDGLGTSFRETEEFIPNEEDGTFRSLAPYCGP